MSARSGIGYDSHRFAEGRPLILGGVEIPDASRGLSGHSDADVLTHALIDALLGAAGLGDIGQHFPDTDERYRDADSMDLLGQVCSFLEDHGWTVRHVPTRASSSLIANPPPFFMPTPYIATLCSSGLHSRGRTIHQSGTRTVRAGCSSARGAPFDKS